MIAHQQCLHTPGHDTFYPTLLPQYLPSPTSHEILLNGFLRFSSLLISDNVNANSVLPLLEQVIQYAAYEDI